MTPSVACLINNNLGEGPVWSQREQALYWIDIKSPTLHRFVPASDKVTSTSLPEEVGCVVLSKKGDALLAMRSGFYCINLDSGVLSHLGDPEPEFPHHRFNDGKCDPLGNFWAGTVHEEETEPEGVLYRYSASGDWKAMREGLIISNGLDWSPDGKTFYFTDSGRRRIYAFDFDMNTGDIANERVFAQDSDYFPDGLCVDEEGYIWSAKWGGWRLVRYAPTGEVDTVIDMPVQQPTSLAFGGPDLKQLYVTSARYGLAESTLLNQLNAGSVFVIETAVAGQAANLFG